MADDVRPPGKGAAKKEAVPNPCGSHPAESYAGPIGNVVAFCSLQTTVTIAHACSIVSCCYRPDKWFWRRGRDSNPRSPVRGTTVFETAPFDRSGTSPRSLDSIRAKTNTGRTPDVATHSHSPPPIYFAFTTREACPLPVSPRQWRQIASSSLHG